MNTIVEQAKGARRRTVVGIHGEQGFALRWRAAAVEMGMDVRPIDAYAPGAMVAAKTCGAFLWHLSHDSENDLRFGRSFLQGLELAGVRVFPDHATCWHFDDKIAQCFLLQAAGAPIPQTWAHFDRGEALSFVREARYPLVFKLRRGAGSVNVRLVRDRSVAERLVGVMFGRGMRPFPPGERMRRIVKRGARGRKDLGRRALGAFRRWWRQSWGVPRERGYCLFQEFVADNDHDVRVIVIGGRAFTVFRRNRPNDFRASGSGLLTHPSPQDIPEEAVRMAQSLSARLGFQTGAFDFLRDQQGDRFVISEVSYSFPREFITRSLGYLDVAGDWREGTCFPEDLILRDLLGVPEAP